MIDIKKKDKIIREFEKAYNKWMQSHQACIEQKKLDESWKKEVEHKYSIAEMAQATFLTWDKLHKTDKTNADKLIEKTKELLIVLLSQYNFGDDIFQDFNIKINATYRDAHLRKIS